MFYLILGINAWTDIKEGCVYDVLSVILFLCALLETGFDWSEPYLWGSALLLGMLWLWDRDEVYFGRGDYLVLVSVSLHAGAHLPWILIATSSLALVFMGLRHRATIPLVPFLFLGTMVTEFLA